MTGRQISMCDNQFVISAGTVQTVYTLCCMNTLIKTCSETVLEARLG